MADEFGIDSAVAVEGFFEGKDYQHLRDSLLHPAKTAALPGPELGADEPDDGDPQALTVLCEAEVDVGEVDEDGNVGAVTFDRGDELAVLGEDVGHVADDFGDAHVGDVLGADRSGRRTPSRRRRGR